MTKIPARFTVFEKMMPCPEGHRWTLSGYNPGDGQRWQLVCIDEKTRGHQWCLPHHGHWKTADFKNYLEGIIDLLYVLERIGKCQ